MPWYAIQTYTGKEEQLTEMVRRVAPEGSFVECFVPYFERLRNWRQQNQIHILRLFPGYAFVITDDINGVFGCLRRLPAMAKVLTSGDFEFTPLYEGETEFLKEILDSDHIVRLTYAATDGKGHVTYLAGPLEKCRDRVLAYKFRDRYAQVRLTIAGQEKTARMGLILDNDVRRETGYGKVEAHVATPEVYIPGRGNATDAKSNDVKSNGAKSNDAKSSAAAGHDLTVGDHVAVVSGAFAGSVAVVQKVRAVAVRVNVHMFGREIPVEMSPVDVRKLGTGMQADAGGGEARCSGTK